MDEQAASPSNPLHWPSVSILILNWNGRGLLQRYLPPLTQLDYPGRYQLVLVDNGSSDDSLAFVEANYPQIKIIANGENLGFSKGMNRGLAQAADKVTVLLNTDVEVRPDWLTELIRPFLSDPQIGIVGSKLYYPDGKTLQHAGVSIEYPRAAAPHRFYGELDTGQADELCAVDSVTGAAMAIHRRVLEAIGLLDERFSPFYYEEVDFCVRARAAGFRVIYQPASVAIHHESYSFGDRRQQVVHDLQCNRLRFVMKHSGGQQLFETFTAAEVADLQTQISPQYVDCLRQIYLELLLELGQTDCQPDEFQYYAAGLVTLAHAASERRSELVREYAMDDYWLLQKAEVAERPFSSQTPVLGGLIVWFRTQWNNVAAKWYVRPLLTQQNEYNRLAAQTLADHDGRLLAQDQDQTDLSRQLAEMTMQMKQMNRLLTEYEQRLLTLEQ